jgi:hypothetical protein
MRAAVLRATGEPMRLENVRLDAAVRLPLDKLLGPEYRLEDINKAYARLPEESVGRGVILIGESR